METIKFNEKKHEYKIGKTKMTPVTEVIKTYFGDINSKELAKKVNKIPTSKYYKKGIRNILKEWKQITEQGTITHKEIYNFILKGIKPETHKAKQAITYLLKNNYFSKTLLPEVIIFNENYGVAGTVDLIIITKNKITIIDWKTNEKIGEKQYEPMKIPIEGLENSTLYKYYMQLNIYAFILQNNGYPIKELQIVNLTEEGQPKVYIVPILTEITKNMLETFKEMKK